MRSHSQSSHSSLCTCVRNLQGSGSVFEGSTAAGSTYEIFEQVAVNLPEGRCLGHLSQVIHTELKAELFQVLNDKAQLGKWFFFRSDALQKTLMRYLEQLSGYYLNRTDCTFLTLKFALPGILVASMSHSLVFRQNLGLCAKCVLYISVSGSGLKARLHPLPVSTKRHSLRELIEENLYCYNN